MKIIIRVLLSTLTLSLLGSMVSCATSPTVSQSNPGTTTTIILTRHGDRDAFAEDLNEKGRARAQALVEAVADMNVTAIYSPEHKRNLDTARPVAEHLGLEINVVPAKVYQVVTTMLTEHPGEVVLWVGNKGNLTEMYSLLKGDGPPPINYGDLFIMVIKDKGEPDITKLRYGPS